VRLRFRRLVLGWFLLRWVRFNDGVSHPQGIGGAGKSAKNATFVRHKRAISCDLNKKTRYLSKFGEWIGGWMDSAGGG